jgi:hypothetical protein
MQPTTYGREHCSLPRPRLYGIGYQLWDATLDDMMVEVNAGNGARDGLQNVTNDLQRCSIPRCSVETTNGLSNQNGQTRLGELGKEDVGREGKRGQGLGC